MTGLVQRIALITGASGGIGREIARQLAVEGIRMVLCGRDPGRLASVPAPDDLVLARICADLRNRSDRERVVAAAMRCDVDLLINAAGTSSFDPVGRTSEEDIRSQIELNLTAPILLTRGLLAHLTSRPAAMIVNVGSTFSRLGFPGFAVYSATKAGLRGFSESLRRELADTAVEVLHFSPRATRTEFNDARVVALNNRLGNPVDEPAVVAAALLDAVIRRRRDVQFGWPEKAFVQINQLLPGLVDGALRRKLQAVEAAVDHSLTDAQEDV